MYAIQSNANGCMPSAPLARSGSPPRCCKHLPSFIQPKLVTHIHTHVHARTYARTHVRTYARTHVRTHARTHVRTHARTHVRTHARTRTTHLKLVESIEAQHSCTIRAHVVPTTRTLSHKQMYTLFQAGLAMAQLHHCQRPEAMKESHMRKTHHEPNAAIHFNPGPRVRAW